MISCAYHDMHRYPTTQRGTCLLYSFMVAHRGRFLLLFLSCYLRSEGTHRGSHESVCFHPAALRSGYPSSLRPKAPRGSQHLSPLPSTVPCHPILHPITRDVVYHPNSNPINSESLPSVTTGVLRNVAHHHHHHHDTNPNRAKTTFVGTF